MGRGGAQGERLRPEELPAAGLSTSALMNNALKVKEIDNFNRPQMGVARPSNTVGPVPREPVMQRSAGLHTSQVSRYTMRQTFVDPDVNKVHAPVTQLSKTQPAKLDAKMETKDIVGARPQSRPGYGMGHYTLGNGMLASYRTTRETNPLQPTYKLPHHQQQHAAVPVSHSTWQYAPSTGRVGSTMNCSDIKGATSPRRRVRSTAYNVLDYSDVNGARFHSPRLKPRQSMSLHNSDIEKSHPNYRQHLPGIQNKVYTTPGQGTLFADDIQGTKPAKGSGGYQLGRHPPPRRPQWVFSTLPRREALSKPNCNSHYADVGIVM